MTKNHLDDAIDRAVRDILTAEPRPGFRGRVLDRIGNRRQSGFGAAWIPALAGAAAVALIAFALVPRGPQSPPRPSPAPVSTAVTAPSAPLTPAPPPERPVTQNPQRVASALPVAPAGRVVATSVDETSADAEDVLLQPLNGVSPLAVDEITETRLTTRDISIGELSVAPIDVAPLPQSGGGPSSPREDR
jgi:hypothetical protein